MEIQELRQGEILILALDGHLDTAAAMPLEQHVLKLIDGGAHRVCADCSRLEYVNSSGLKIFLLAAKRLETLGGKLAICCLAPNVQMIFEMIGFSKILAIYATRDEALATLQGASSNGSAAAATSV